MKGTLTANGVSEPMPWYGGPGMAIFWGTFGGGANLVGGVSWQGPRTLLMHTHSKPANFSSLKLAYDRIQSRQCLPSVQFVM